MKSDINSPKNWPKDYERGDNMYTNDCRFCQSEFLGHKGHTFCRQCAEKIIIHDIGFFFQHSTDKQVEGFLNFLLTKYTKPE